jgi:hypothetical protein
MLPLGEIGFWARVDHHDFSIISHGICRATEVCGHSPPMTETKDDAMAPMFPASATYQIHP